MIRIYGIKEKLNPIKARLSDVINQCTAEALSFPENKRAYREQPASNWGFRGMTGDEASLNYKVNV